MEEYSYNNYTKARDAVWELMLNSKVCSLPVDVFLLAKEQKIHVITYSKSKILRLMMRLNGIAKENEAMAVMFCGKKFIFYDDTIMSEGRIRFTIAHEIGHFLMLHHNGNSSADFFKVKCAQRGKNKTAKEREANAFAARLLAPACVLNKLNVQNAEEIMETCGMSHEAAVYRMERLKTLRERNRFYSDKREKAVEEKFKDFINNQTTNQNSINNIEGQ